MTRSNLRLALLSAPIVLLALTNATAAQQSFGSPDQAIEALVKAARDGDRKAIVTVLGPDGADIASSGDDVADAAGRERFLAAFDTKHQVAMDGDNKAIMVIGSEDFPFPIPLVKKDGNWRFDTAAGRDEILFRRIGRNELNAIQAMLAYVDAQNEYADKDRGAGVGVYAQRIVSRAGKTDGLYWPAAQGDQSPLGELVAQANAEGYRTKGGEERTPFHGYYFKILSRQGPAARGGTLDYVVDGKMVGGFALVAYPASYRNSGVMTFMVNHDGVIFQKDLGPETARIAERMSVFNPDASWTIVTDTELVR